MNTYTKIGGALWGAQKSTNRMSFCALSALRESGTQAEADHSF
jgi:hypothetical protein